LKGYNTYPGGIEKIFLNMSRSHTSLPVVPIQWIFSSFLVAMGYIFHIVMGSGIMLKGI
jgi:hypothetical protein